MFGAQNILGYKSKRKGWDEDYMRKGDGGRVTFIFRCKDEGWRGGLSNGRMRGG